MKFFSLITEGETVNSLLALRTYLVNGEFKYSSFEIYLTFKGRYLLLRFRKERLLPFIYYGKFRERAIND